MLGGSCSPLVRGDGGQDQVAGARGWKMTGFDGRADLDGLAEWLDVGCRRRGTEIGCLVDLLR